VFGNGDVRIFYVVVDIALFYYCNVIGDECVYVEAGAAMVEIVFGVFEV